MKKIGITGGIGSGKSRVLDFLNQECGAVICQADLVAHQVQLPGELCYQEVVKTFGGNILKQDKSIDRQILGEIVFDDPKKLEELNAIVHPAVNKRIEEEMAEAEKEGKKVFILEAALLTQPVYRNMLDEIWYIHVEQEIRMERLRTSRGYTDEKMYAVFANQPTEEAFIKAADLVIENSGDFEETKRQLCLALEKGRRQGE